MPGSDEPTFAAPRDEAEEEEAGDDYVFRFPLGEEVVHEQGYDDPLLELIRGQLADLLDVVVLTEQGRRVRVDGFRLLQDPETQYGIFPRREEGSQ
jgi:hypothetical protein